MIQAMVGHDGASNRKLMNCGTLSTKRAPDSAPSTEPLAIRVKEHSAKIGDTFSRRPAESSTQHQVIVMNPRRLSFHAFAC